MKPSGIYLKHLRTTTLESEINSADTIFGEHDVVRDYIREHALDTVGDLYEEELSIYTGSTGKAVHTEISIRLPTTMRETERADSTETVLHLHFSRYSVGLVPVCLLNMFDKLPICAGSPLFLRLGARKAPSPLGDARHR